MNLFKGIWKGKFYNINKNGVKKWIIKVHPVQSGENGIYICKYHHHWIIKIFVDIARIDVA